MSPHGPWAIGAILAAAVQEAAGAAAETVAARPEIAERRLRFLAGAYTAIWVILAVYLLSLSVRLRRLSQQVRRLKEKIGI